ncbi:MAG: family 10 glycosylhydrolase [Oscillospiraceae bacterium]|nr:family 10 glycosylhydrolase [Oscillospiraceae bacterium]
MKQKRISAYIALALTIVLLITGCAAGLVETEPAGGRLALVDNTPSEAFIPARPENPQAGDDTALAGIGTIAQTAIQASAAGTADTFRNNTPRMRRVTGEVRGVWISFLEFDHMLRGQSREQFTANIRRVFDNSVQYGLNTVIVQVRPFGDAIYPSAYFPWSQFVTGTEGIAPNFDPLAIMVDEAHARGMRFEAWINPYRIRAAGSVIPLSADNQAARWIAEGNSAVIQYNGIISYNPASQAARQLIVNGVRELVRNYSIDAIHIDDYFYPTTSPGFDAASFQAYRNQGGTLHLGDWRRQNVETLLREMYAAIKAEDPRVEFGISPQSRIDYNFENLYLDVRKISSQPGFTDYIMPQIYFGFAHATQPFQRVLEEWDAIVNPNYVRLYIGLAAYKSGVEDTWAGEAGINEWRGNTNLLRRQVEASRRMASYSGFVLFRYDSIFNPAAAVASYVERENQNLRALLQ